MTSSAQTLVALVIVASAAVWLVARAVAKRRKPGCGGECDCPTQELKR